MKIYVLGNPLVQIDSLPIRVLPMLKKEFPKIEFIEFDPSEDFMPSEKNMIIIDTVLEIKKVEIIRDIERIILQKAYSLHDFDLGYNIKLMKKFGMIDNVLIIGVPPFLDEKETLIQVKNAIKSLEPVNL